MGQESTARADPSLRRVLHWIARQMGRRRCRSLTHPTTYYYD